jgi:hypothetical protein
MNDPTGNDGQQQRRGPFHVDEDQALAALELAWEDTCDEFWVSGGVWGAHLKGAPDNEVVTGATPDELHANLQAAAASRSGS